MTITIAGNREHTISTGMMQYSKYPCCDIPACPSCQGKGETKYEVLPYELNLANVNFAHLWNTLGLTTDEDGGSCDGRVILRKLAGAPLPVRQGYHKIGDQGAESIDPGIDTERAERYYYVLKEIAEEATRREELVIWG